MTVTLTPAEADHKISEVNQLMTQIRQTLNKWQDEGQTMTSSSWKGASASMFTTKQGDHESEFTEVLQTMERITSLGTEHMRKIASQDNG